jgi:hypothetical protein
MAEAKVKAYVEVTASFDQEGRLWPQEIIWEDGRRYTIDKVVELRQAASLKAGGQGDRYTIRVGGRETYLFFERSCELTGSHLGRWFVERRKG